MKSWRGHLAILVLPLLVIGGVIAAGIDRANEQEVFIFAALAFGAGTLATAAAARLGSRTLPKVSTSVLSLCTLLEGHGEPTP
jgi:hypothetical protein